MCRDLISLTSCLKPKIFLIGAAGTAAIYTGGVAPLWVSFMVLVIGRCVLGAEY